MYDLLAVIARDAPTFAVQPQQVRLRQLRLCVANLPRQTLLVVAASVLLGIHALLQIVNTHRQSVALVFCLLRARCKPHNGMGVDGDRCRALRQQRFAPTTIDFSPQYEVADGATLGEDQCSTACLLGKDGVRQRSDSPTRSMHAGRGVR